MSDATQSKPHELDTLIVYNPDLNCHVIDSDEGYPHADYFQVRWSNKPHRIAPGATKRMPRFLAEHYAKHLADHLLTRMEEETKRKGLMQSPVERPRVLAQIIKGVDTYFLGEEHDDLGDKTEKLVQDLNPEERPIDLGTVVNPMVGILKPEPKPVVLEEPNIPEPVVKVKNDNPSIWDESKPKPTKKELMADCEKLGIEISGKEDVETLIQKIKAF